MHLLHSQEVLSAIKAYLINLGFNEEDSEITAKVLVEGNRRGYPNHGVSRLTQIIEGYNNGKIATKPDVRVISEGIAYKVIDAGYCLGQPIGVKAMQMAVDIAKETGIALVGVNNACHLGILAYYAEIASKSGMLGIAMSTTSPAVVVPGGKTKLLGTNPLAYSFPLKDKLFTADFSTSSISRAKLLEYRMRGEKLPDGLAVNCKGEPTTDPEEALQGGLLPHGGDIKGALISILISVISGPLIGGLCNHMVTGTRYMDSLPTKSDIFISIDIEKFTPLNTFTAKCEDYFMKMIEDNTDFRIPSSGKNKTDIIELSDDIYTLLAEYLP